MSKKYRLAALTSHPIQYQTPLFKRITSHPNIDLIVYFCSDIGVKEGYVDSSGFGVNIKWDIPLLEGYKYKFMPNVFSQQISGFWGRVNSSIIKEIRSNHYDAIWIHGYSSLTDWLAFFGSWVSETPVMLRGESHLLNYRPGWKKVFKRIVLQTLFRRIGCFLSIGALNTEYYKYYGVPEKKIFLTPYCVDNEFFSGKYKELYGGRNNLKKRLGLPSELPVILYASKMMPRKRPMDLMKAYEKIQDKINVALVFVGDGMERQALEKYAKNNNLRNVYFEGFKNQTELPEYFSIADVFVLPSTDEPWGLIINEAMNFGLPIITTDQVGAALDLVKDGENGFIYPVGDIGKLAECSLKLLRDAELREKMRRKSLEMIEKWSYQEDISGILSALEYVKTASRKVV